MTSIALPLPAARSRADVYRARYVIAFAVTLASVLELVDTSIVNVAIPHMMGNLGATLEEIAWVSTGYIVANVIVLPMTSFFSDTFGRRNYYTGSIALFTAASFFCGQSHSLEQLVFWRVIQGIGGGALISTAQAILFDVFPREERGTSTAIFGMGVMVGPLLGPTLGGWITANYSWPWIFYINLPLGIIAAVLCWQFVPEPSVPVRRGATGIDWLGLFFLAVGIGSLQILLERGQSKDWFASKEIVVEAILAASGLVAFVWRELVADQPMVDLRILRSRQMATGVTFALVLGFALYASVFVLPVFLQGLLGYSAWDTGLVMFPGAIASAITMAVVGRLTQKMDARPLVVAGVLLYLVSMTMHWQFTLDTGLHDTLLPIVIRGVGIGLVFVPLTAMTVADLKPQQMAQGTGLFNLSRQLGGSLGIAAAATLVTRFAATARAGLLPHLDPSDPRVRAWIDQVTAGMTHLGASLPQAQARAYQLLSYRLQQQASLLAYDKIYLTMGIVFTCALPLLLFFRTGRVTGKVEAH
ncbi:MAG TPA: DHA2 family efflux MFS transporter permease subunit, partial [Gemmatimonadales bacterium]|jgi:DHA2 family multidrug resistance protein